MCSSSLVNAQPSAASNLGLTNNGHSMVVGFTDNAHDETGDVLHGSADAQDDTRGDVSRTNDSAASQELS